MRKDECVLNDPAILIATGAITTKTSTAPRILPPARFRSGRPVDCCVVSIGAQKLASRKLYLSRRLASSCFRAENRGRQSTLDTLELQPCNVVLRGGTRQRPRFDGDDILPITLRRRKVKLWVECSIHGDERVKAEVTWSSNPGVCGLGRGEVDGRDSRPSESRLRRILLSRIEGYQEGGCWDVGQSGQWQARDVEEASNCPHTRPSRVRAGVILGSDVMKRFSHRGHDLYSA